MIMAVPVQPRNHRRRVRFGVRGRYFTSGSADRRLNDDKVGFHAFPIHALKELKMAERTVIGSESSFRDLVFEPETSEGEWC